MKPEAYYPFCSVCGAYHFAFQPHPNKPATEEYRMTLERLPEAVVKAGLRRQRAKAKKRLEVKGW